MYKGWPLAAPLQIEIHPYHRSQGRPCNNECLWCTRGSDRLRLQDRDVRGIEPDRLMQFVASFRGHKIPEFALAGNATEPLLSPDIEDVLRVIKDIGSTFRLYTNGQQGHKLVGLAHLFTDDDVIRYSLDAGSTESYAATHRPMYPRAFDRVLDNIQQLLRRRAETDGRFTVAITYLLNQMNSDSREIAFIMRWAAERRRCRQLHTTSNPASLEPAFSPSFRSAGTRSWLTDCAVACRALLTNGICLHTLR